MATGFDIERFVRAQGSGTYEQALAEIRAGRKRSHWIWFVFPQARGLGRSPMAERYGISSRAELDEYVNHPLLRARLTEISHALLALPESDPIAVLGDIDALKVRSSMTRRQSRRAHAENRERVLGAQPEMIQKGTVPFWIISRCGGWQGLPR